MTTATASPTSRCITTWAVASSRSLRGSATCSGMATTTAPRGATTTETVNSTWPSSPTRSTDRTARCSCTTWGTVVSRTSHPDSEWTCAGTARRRCGRISTGTGGRICSLPTTPTSLPTGASSTTTTATEPSPRSRSKPESTSPILKRPDRGAETGDERDQRRADVVWVGELPMNQVGLAEAFPEREGESERGQQPLEAGHALQRVQASLEQLSESRVAMNPRVLGALEHDQHFGVVTTLDQGPMKAVT